VTVLLWWSLASIAVSLLAGALLGFGRREDASDVVDLEFLAELATPTSVEPNRVIEPVETA